MLQARNFLTLPVPSFSVQLKRDNVFIDILLDDPGAGFSKYLMNSLTIVNITKWVTS